MEGQKSTNEQTLEATITYLEGLPTGTSTESAIENIDGWEKKLRSENKPEWNSIADELKNLKSFLTTGQLDGTSISQSLIRLGNLTTQSASGADDSIADDLKKLGKWLTRLGQSLS
jgi:glutamate mutase epsilon subunit